MDGYDLIVIGTGTAAQVVSSRVRRAGRSVAAIDHRPFGGTCALRGCDPKKMRILGAHLVGPHADEVINLFGLAIRHNLTADDLKTTMFAYPTGASDIGSML